MDIITDANPIGFSAEIFQPQQNVNGDNMNKFYLDKDQKFAAYFSNYSQLDNTNIIQVGSICSGIGSLLAINTLSVNFGQVDTSNTFNLRAGVLRFLDQLVTYPKIGSGTIDVLQAIYAYNEGGELVVNSLPTNDGTKYYVVAEVSIPLETSGTNFTCTIQQTVVSQADLITNQTTGVLSYIALFNISSLDGVNFTIGTDKYCANNYNTYNQQQVNNGLYNQFRLSIQSNNPEYIPESDVKQSSGTLYFTPTTDGNLLSLYDTDTSSWVTNSYSEISGYVGAIMGVLGVVCDIYVSLINGVLTLSSAQWTGGSKVPPSRTKIDGRLVATADYTKLLVGIAFADNIGGVEIQSWNGVRNLRNFYNKISLKLRANLVGNYNQSDTSGNIVPQGTGNIGQVDMQCIFDSTSEPISIIYNGSVAIGSVGALVEQYIGVDSNNSFANSDQIPVNGTSLAVPTSWKYSYDPGLSNNNGSHLFFKTIRCAGGGGAVVINDTDGMESSILA